MAALAAAAPASATEGRDLCPDRPGLGFTLRADALDKFRYRPGPEFVF